MALEEPQVFGVKEAITDKGGYRQINKALNICAFDDYLKSQIRGLAQILPIQQLSPRILRILGQNPGKFTLQGTNTFIVGTGTFRILIDTSGGEPEYAVLLASALAERGIILKYVLITHWHGDHSGGAPDLLRLYPHLQGHIYKNQPEPDQQGLEDGQTFKVEGATVTCVHAPGHSEDHMCFVLEEENAMFTGDNMLGVGTTAVENLATYMSSLEKMASKRCITGHPGHGPTINNLPAKIQAELATKRSREDKISTTLRQLQQRSRTGLSVGDLVTEMYGVAMDAKMRALVLEPLVDEILRKLAVDGRVRFESRCGLKRWFCLP
ncbi:hypothetical protein BST61_g9284 [Cercospora zeina]